ncbi:MAG TPA: hypothetical protein VHO48_09670 [Anaerolineaceae bacterium]|nr:hypothetical protein [Anaerolineaceae bacterium]
MDLIEIYVQNVGQHLPAKNREDIQNEIRSLIHDALEDESRSQGREADEEMTVAVLKRMGSPEQVAASYQPPRYVVSPQMYPYFMTVLRVVLSIIVIVGAIGLGVSMGQTGGQSTQVTDQIGQAFLELINAVFYTIGMIVVIFALIERLNPNLKVGSKDWDPRKLRAEPDPEQAKPAGAIVQIVFDILGIIVLTQYREWIGFATIVDGRWAHSPVLTAAFDAYIPWFCLLWALDAGLHALLLAQGRYTPWLRWLKAGLTALGIVIAAFLLAGPTIAALDPTTFAQMGWNPIDPAVLQAANQGLETAFRIGIGISLALQVVELGKQLYHLVLRQRLPEALG